MTGPHQGQPLRTAGTPVESATAAGIFLHGRGATAQSILEMHAEFDTDAVAYLAPQASGNTWYPDSFLAPVERNEPGRSSGLQAIEDAISAVTEAGIPRERILLLGFSQGGCLASEFVARNPDRYGGLVALSGGLIGSDLDRDDYEGSLAGTPVFLGCSDVDPHIPKERVEESAAIFEQLGADVEMRLYEGMGHGVNADELEYVAGMIDSLTA